MTRWRGTGFIVALSVVPLAIGCSGTGPGPGGAAASTLAACGRLFDVAYNAQCFPTRLPPASELSRVRSRFEQACASALDLPGVRLGGDQLNACVDAYAEAGCPSLVTPAECDTPGALANGASCRSDLQCQSNSCVQPTTVSNPDGGSPEPPCGTCLPAIPAGQPCGSGQGSCAAGLACDYGATPPTCTAVVAGDVGAPCNSAIPACKTGLFCDFEKGTCEVPGGAGAACTTSSAGCTPPLACLVTIAGTCESPGQAGAACLSDSNCVPPLGCGNGTCGAIDWASGGQPCDGVSRCLVGYCVAPVNQTGVCPTVIADGQPCIPGDQTRTCDTPASCTGGICTLVATSACE